MLYEMNEDSSESVPLGLVKKTKSSGSGSGSIRISYESDGGEKVEARTSSPHSPPTQNLFMEQYKAIKEFRDRTEAPVDTMGCFMLGGNDVGIQDQRFQKLIGVMLSVQTKDEITHATMQRVVKEKLTMEKAITMSKQELRDIIKHVNFNNKKAEFIRHVASTIIGNHKGVFPTTYDEIVELRGVGPKIAHLFLQCAFGKTEGIAVDTHVHRIANRIGWVSTSTPEKTRLALEELTDKNIWSDINQILVGFGQIHCKALKPACETCVVKHSCKFATTEQQNNKPDSKVDTNIKQAVDPKQKKSTK